MTGHFSIFAWDRPGIAVLREETRSAHFRHIETVIDQIAIAGPIRNEEGQNIGSLLVLKAASPAEAEAIFRADPYFKAGIWERWEIHPFLPAAGEWIEGRIW